MPKILISILKEYNSVTFQVEKRTASLSRVTATQENIYLGSSIFIFHWLSSAVLQVIMFHHFDKAGVTGVGGEPSS